MTLREIYTSCFNIYSNIEVFVFDEIEYLCNGVEENAIANFIFPPISGSSNHDFFNKYKDIKVYGFRLVDFKKNKDKAIYQKSVPLVARKLYVFIEKGNE